MSTEKFTQGEWVTRPGNTTVLDKKSTPIAMVYRAEYYRSKEESFANAALIKAAPVMYNLLKLMTEPTFMSAMIPQELRTAIEQVLKIARGEK